MFSASELNPNEFIYFDFETTGLDPKADRICQIGAILPDGTELDVLINPGCSIPQSAIDCHGITDEMVSSASYFNEYAELLLKSLAQAKYFVAYNFVFDFQFLQYELHRATGHILKEADFTFIDPYLIFKKAFPHSLANAYKFYFAKEFKGMHNAINDIRATKEVFIAQMEKHSELFSSGLEKLESETLGSRKSILGKWFKTEDSKIIFTQGKYKGLAIASEHNSYLKWILGLDDITLSEKVFIESLL
jgi:DNA polymerase-3 subunit epsilon